MSKISKYLQINEKLLLEYTYDINAIAKNKNCDAYILKDKIGKLMYFENPTPKNITTDFKKGFMFNSFPLTNIEDSWSYPGYLRNPSSEDAIISDPTTKLKDFSLINDVVAHSTTIDIPYETVRVYIMSGYTFNDCLGFILSIRTNQSADSEYKSSENEVILQNFTFHKGMMSTCVKFANKPFYQQSRFYDRYIEITFPSAWYMANHKSSVQNNKETHNFFDILNIESGKLVEFNFATIEDNQFEARAYDDEDYQDFYKESAYDFTDRILYNQGSFGISGFTTAQVALTSNSDNFNLRLWEDTDNNCLRYYPIWGDVIDDNPITRRIMNSIENGSIPMSLNGFLDENDSDLEDFEAIYGEEARKWIIVNQIELDYHYQPMISSVARYDNEIVISKKFNYTEDFEFDDDNYTSIDDIYKFLYRPVIQPLNNGYVCNYIAVTYTGRLVNRLNGSEIIRVATLDINDAESKFGINAQKIDVSNIYTWKLFNKIQSDNITVQGQSTGTNRTKYVTRFVQNNNFTMVDENGNSNTDGKFVIRLYDTEHLYKMTLFTDVNMTTPYQLGEANVNYLMRITYGPDNTPLYLKPTYSIDMNSVIGELEFKITEELSNKILQGDKKWHIVAKTETGVSTLFAGKFESIFD